ncbi:MAG: hypothetical protein KU37_02325 [Sulfuricurvum sp. PC08-66]|nr:MAG: hypothetical protein KU37_02325 [Sulfuricurvum sp. PC08-66]
MNMKLLAAIGAALIAGLVAYSYLGSRTADGLPKLSKDQVQGYVASELATYEARGFSVVKEGEIYRVSVANTQEVERFLVEKVEHIAPATYAPFISEWKKSIDAGEGISLEGLAAEVEVIEDDQGAKAQVRLVALPQEAQAQLKEASAQMPKEVAQLDAFITQGKLSYTLRFDENGNVAGMALGDIQESFVFQESNKLDVVSQGLFGIVKGDLNSSYEMVMEWKKLQMKLDMGDEGKLFFETHDIKSKVDQKDTLNTKSDTSIAHMSMEFQEKNYYGEPEQKGFDLKNMSIVSQIKSDDKTVALKSKTVIENFKIKAIEGPAVVDTSLDNLVFDMSIDRLDAQGTKEVLEFMSNLSDEMGTQQMRQIANAVERISQAGFEMRIDKLDVDSLNVAYEDQNITLDRLHFDLKVVLAPNTVVIDNYMALLESISVSGTFSMGQKGYEALRTLQPAMFATADNYKEVKGDNVLFAYSFAQGKALINGKPFE